MFERFTAAARGVVVGAQTQARVLGHREILAEHLLLAVLDDKAAVSAGVLGGLGVQRDALAREVRSLGVTDDEALRAIGVDLAAVRERAEAAFGPGALDRPRPRRVGLLGRVVGARDHLRFTAPAKAALEQSLRQALSLGHNYIGTDHILLGLLHRDRDPAAHTLARLGADPALVRERVRDRLRHVA